MSFNTPKRVLTKDEIAAAHDLGIHVEPDGSVENTFLEAIAKRMVIKARYASRTEAQRKRPYDPTIDVRLRDE